MTASNVIIANWPQTCPCCGRLADDSVVINLAKNAVVRGFSTASLTPRERQVAMILLAAAPNPLRHEEIMEAIFGDRADGGPERGNNWVSVYINKIRRKLDPLGIAIVSRYQFGYSIRLDTIISNGSVGAPVSPDTRRPYAVPHSAGTA